MNYLRLIMANKKYINSDHPYIIGENNQYMGGVDLIYRVQKVKNITNKCLHHILNFRYETLYENSGIKNRRSIEKEIHKGSRATLNRLLATLGPKEAMLQVS